MHERTLAYAAVEYFTENKICFLFAEFTKLLQQRQLLDGQLNENKSVLEELNLLGEDNNVSFQKSLF